MNDSENMSPVISLEIITRRYTQERRQIRGASPYKTASMLKHLLK